MDPQALSSVLQSVSGLSSSSSSTPPSYSALIGQLKPLPPGYKVAYLNIDVFKDQHIPLTQAIIDSKTSYSKWHDMVANCAVPFNYDLGAFMTGGCWFSNPNSQLVTTSGGLTLLLGLGALNGQVLNFGGLTVNVNGGVVTVAGHQIPILNPVGSGVTFYTVVYDAGNSTLTLYTNLLFANRISGIKLPNYGGGWMVGNGGPIADVVLYEKPLNLTDISSAIAVLSNQWPYAQDVISYEVNSSVRQKAIYLFNLAMTTVQQEAETDLTLAKSSFQQALSNFSTALLKNTNNSSNWTSGAASLTYAPTIASLSQTLPGLESELSNQSEWNSVVSNYTSSNAIEPDKVGKIVNGHYISMPGLCPVSFNTPEFDA